MQQNTPIQRRMMRVIMLTCGIVLLLTFLAFISYEYYSFRENTRNELFAVGEIIGNNSTAALAFDNTEDAAEVLSSVKIRKNIRLACIYDETGKLFATYPADVKPSELPAKLLQAGYRTHRNKIEVFIPVIQSSNYLGTVYLESDMGTLYQRMLIYVVAAFLFFAISFLIAFLISKRLQRSISHPILQLAAHAEVISKKKDYSVRAPKYNNDEVGTLTDAFNMMLNTIQNQNDEISALNIGLEQKVKERTSQLQQLNVKLVQQNEFVQTILDSSVDLIAVFNEEMRFLSLNKQAEVVYAKSRKDMIGKTVLEIFPQLNGSSFHENFKKALDGEFVHQPVYRSISSRTFENFFVPLQNVSGKIDRVLVIGHDISSLINVQEELRVVNAALEKSNTDLEQFAYVASHDLQEPLRKIRMFSELAQVNISNTEVATKYLEKTNKAAERMTSLIHDVLNYSRISGNATEFTQVSLEEVLQDVLVDLELTINEKGAIVQHQPLPVIKAISLQMHQLFLNLVSNSLKFCEKQPSININWEIIPPDPGAQSSLRSIKLYFQDNGIGFEPAFIDQAFAIFKRLHNNKTYGGTGIGLAVCKKIVENHGGSIVVKSRVGEGSLFTIYLPHIMDMAEQSIQLAEA